MNDNQASRDTLWTTVTVFGVLWGVTLGAFMMLWLRDRRRSSASILQLQSTSATPIEQPLVAGFEFPSNPVDIGSMPRQTAARSSTVGTKTPTQILRALGARHWKVQVMVVSPPGSMVTFSCGNTIGEGIVVPAGGFREMWLAPGEDLFAQSDTANTVVSVSGGEH